MPRLRRASDLGVGLITNPTQSALPVPRQTGCSQPPPAAGFLTAGAPVLTAVQALNPGLLKVDDPVAPV